LILSLNLAGNERKAIKQPVPTEDALKSAFKSIDDVPIGATLQGKIWQISDFQLSVDLGGKLRGRVHVTEVQDYDDESKIEKQPMSKFKVGQVITVKVIFLFFFFFFFFLIFFKNFEPAFFLS